MSYAVDANVLLYAADSSSARHGAAVAFLNDCAQRDEPLCLTWGVISAFLRLSTSHNVYASPLTPRDAMELVDELLNLPQARVLTEEPGFWKVYQAVATDVPPRGKAVSDAHRAALLRLHGVKVLYTSDADFRRYGFLKPVDPFSAK